MNIKITKTDKLKAALEEVQKRSRVRTITVECIHMMCIMVENRLGLTKKAINGVTFVADWNASDFPKAYKGIPESTIIYAEYKDGWRIFDIRRERTHPKSSMFRVNLTPEAKEALIKKHEQF